MKKRVIIIVLFIIAIILLSLLYLFYNPFLKISVNGKTVYEIELGKEFKIKSATATLLFKKLDSKIKVSSNLDTSKVGKYKITYKIKYLYTTKKKVITINVVDKEPPVINIIGESEIKLCPGKKYEEEGYKAEDNYDGDITDKVVKNELDNYIEYSVSDSSKNKTLVKRNIIYEDNEKPKLILKGSSAYTIQINSKFSDPGYTVSDNCDEEIYDKVKIINNVDTSKEGTYYITYKVVDNSENESSISRTIKVVNRSYIADYVNIIEGPTYINGILIVNKQYSIPSSYGNGEDPIAYEALTRLQAAANNEGYSLPVVSGYRSYYLQKTIYNNYVKSDGQSLADTYSARPGHSEHQTGLAFDVGAIDYNLGNTPRGIWLKEHAHEYGFIIRYLKGKEHITGYKYEPWHIRYVGLEHASKIYERGITLEEYLGLY